MKRQLQMAAKPSPDAQRHWARQLPATIEGRRLGQGSRSCLQYRAGRHIVGDTPNASTVNRPTAAILLAIVVLAIPIAWLTATLGFTIAVVAPPRDVALLLLWSTSEEIVFRGGLQPLLGWLLARAALHGSAPHQGWTAISMANLLTSLLFCAAHLLYKPGWVVLGLFPVSLVLGASLERSGRLWVPVALHAYFNLLLYAASALASL